MKRLLHIFSVLSVLLFSSMVANGQEVMFEFVGADPKSPTAWNNVNNWSGGVVPGTENPAQYDMKVHIPAGKTVVIDDKDNVPSRPFFIEGTVDIQKKNQVILGHVEVAATGVLTAKKDLQLKDNNGDGGVGTFEIYGSVTVGGSLSCGNTHVYAGASLSCSGQSTINSKTNGGGGWGMLVIEGTANMNGLQCHGLNVSGSLTAKGNVKVGGNGGGDGTMDVTGNVTLGGSLNAGSVLVGAGSDIVCKGDVNLGYGSGSLVFDGGSIEFYNQLNFAVLDIKTEDGNAMIVDVDKILVNGWGQPEYHPELRAIISTIESKLSIVKDAWTGAKDSNWFEKTNWSGGKVPASNYIVTIPSGCRNYPVIEGDVAVALSRSVFFEQGATLTVEDGGAAVFGRLYTDGTYDGSRIVINNRYDKVCSLRITDGVIKKTVGDSDIDYNKLTINTEYLTGITYYIGSATTEGTFTGWLDNLNNESVKAGKRDELYLYNPVMQEFSFGQAISGVKGASVYLYWKQDGVTKNTRTLTQKGTIRKQNDGIIESLSLRAGEQFGWNIISNPYLFAFNLEDEGQFNKSDDIDFVMFRRFRNGSYESVTHSFGTGVTLPNDATEMSGELYIAPQQGFYVKAKKAGSYFGFVPSKVPSTGAGSIGSSTLKAAKVVNDVLYLSLNGNVSSKGEDQTALVFREGGSLSVNSIDADKKMESAVNNQLYLLKEGGEYAIGLYPEVGDMYDEVIPLGYIAAKGATEATIRAINLSEFDQNTDVLLLDMYSGDSYDLRENDTYSFSVDESGVRVDDRFAIALKANKSAESDVPTSLEDVEKSVIAISGSTGAVVVDLVGLDGEADVCIYDVAGRVVSRAKALNGINRISVASKGVCVVEVVGGKAVKNAKVIVR